MNSPKIQRLLGGIARRHPWMLGLRVRFIVWTRMLLYPLRFLPVSSKYFGPPKGQYKSLRHFQRCRESTGWVEIIRLAGRVSTTRWMPKTNSKLVEKRFSQLRRLLVREQSVGILRKGRVWGYDGGNVITGTDRLIWDLSPVNYTFRRDLHHVFSTLKLPRVAHYGRVVNMTTRGADTNYGHWMHDLVPRFELLQRAKINLSDAHILVNHRELPFQKETLSRLNIPPDRVIQAAPEVHIEAEELILPSVLNPNMNTDSFGYPSEAYQFLRELFLGENANARQEPPTRRIYISRQKSRRSLKNEPEVIERLQSLGFEAVCLEDYTVTEQARMFSEAECVLGFHGAGLTNIVFCRPGTTIIEVFSPDFIVSNFWTFSNQNGFRYHCYSEDERYTGVQGNRFQRVVEQSVSSEKLIEFVRSVVASARPSLNSLAA